MKGVLWLFKGEVRRLALYKILPVSLVTSLLWAVLYLFLPRDEAVGLTPLFIFVDITLMSVLLIGASFHLEKQEGTMKAMMVLPVSTGQILAAKIAASMLLALESAVVTSVALFVIHGAAMHYGALLVFVIIAGAAHAAIGFFLSLYSRDFGFMLALLMAYMLAMTMPSILQMIGVIAVNEWILFLSPSHSGSMLITSAVTGEFDAAKVAAAVAYLAALTAALIRFAVYPKFKKSCAKG